jgi:hypothetical protein
MTTVMRLTVSLQRFAQRHCCTSAVRVCIWLCVLGATSSRLALGFDISWHYLATAEATSAAHFTTLGTAVTQLGALGPDFFWVLHHHLISERIERLKGESGLALVPGLGRLFVQTRQDDPRRVEVRRAASFLHFDNLEGELDSNQKVHFVFHRTLANTTRLIRDTYADPHLDAETKRVIILLAVGSSLHLVQDFYSHSNWVHVDFARFGMRGALPHRVPTYFEACQFFGCPEEAVPALPFEVEVGIYPTPTAPPLTQEGVPKGHEQMHHDNTQLFSDGQDMVHYHAAGLVSGLASREAHQQVAVATAVAASKEWLVQLSEPPEVRRALHFASQIKGPTLLVQDDARTALEAVARVSCLVGKWDGDHPAASQERVCQALKLTTSRVLVSLLRGRRELLPNAFNRYWSLYVQANIMERLTAGFGDTQHTRYDFSHMHRQGEEPPQARLLPPPRDGQSPAGQRPDHLMGLGLALIVGFSVFIGLDPVGRLLDRLMGRVYDRCG